jgi:maleylacetate reductase
MIEVPAGQVDVVAAQLRAAVTGSRLVALGGGRVIDVAKALAAADPPRDVVAIPTSLSAAEMTGVHRRAQGVAPGTPCVRPVLVINDPRLSAHNPPMRWRPAAQTDWATPSPRSSAIARRRYHRR